MRWRHSGRDGVSNHQPHDCLINRLFGRRSKKTSKLRVTGLCVGNSPVNSPHKWPITRKMFPFDELSCDNTLSHIRHKAKISTNVCRFLANDTIQNNVSRIAIFVHSKIKEYTNFLPLKCCWKYGQQNDGNFGQTCMWWRLLAYVSIHAGSETHFHTCCYFEMKIVDSELWELTFIKRKRKYIHISVIYTGMFTKPILSVRLGFKFSQLPITGHQLYITSIFSRYQTRTCFKGFNIFFQKKVCHRQKKWRIDT